MPGVGGLSDPIARLCAQRIHEIDHADLNTRILRIGWPDDPLRDYYVGVRMAVLRERNHGYRLCNECGEPFLPRPRNHVRPLLHRAEVAVPAA